MKQKIAIIEDEAAIAEMYRFKLEQRGYQVECALDGKRGLALVKNFRPDLILLDLMMPELTGDAMLEKVRAEEWGGDIRVIVLTNISKDEAPSRLRFLNVDRYIVKAHHTPTQVASIVGEILNKPA
ncbi:MAG TPA: response regulator [Candidatus Saccharimonadales bacterium]|nr:response regulator [Candidatus Saccharimonadales bacterium]